MLDLFSIHFEELTDSLESTLEIACDKIECQKAYKNRRIGFNVDSNDSSSRDIKTVQALRR